MEDAPRTETTRIANLLKHAYDGTPWYGKPLLKLVADVTPEQAAATIAGTHSIWQEVRHVIAWRQVVCRLLNGEPAAELTDSENWPPPAATITPADWQATLDELAQTQLDLQAAIAGLTDDRLREKAPGKTRSLFVLLHGIIQHDVYHAGQIALLRKLSP